MTDKSQQLKHPGGGVLSALSTAIDDLNIAKDVADVAPARVTFDTVAVLLTTIRVRLLLQ